MFFMERNYICLFHISGNLPLKECLKITFNGKTNDWLQIFIILIDILSQPWALLGSNVFTIANISFSVTWKDLILLPVLYEKDGKQLVLSIGVHIEAKKVIENVCFFTKVWNQLTTDKERWYCSEFFITE